jgi:hypothetical protein
VNSRIGTSCAAFLEFGLHDEQERLMTKTLRLLSLTGLLTVGAATAMAAGDPGGSMSSQSMTGTQTGSQQVPTSATGSQYNTGTPTTTPTYTYPRTGMNTPSSEQYPGQVGPTGSHEPDATNPSRSSPSGGGGSEGGSTGAGSR